MLNPSGANCIGSLPDIFLEFSDETRTSHDKTRTGTHVERAIILIANEIFNNAMRLPRRFHGRLQKAFAVERHRSAKARRTLLHALYFTIFTVSKATTGLPSTTV